MDVTLPTGADRPNVLIVITDQHRSDLMTCAGDGTVPTPHIDRIAARGVRFENAYSAYPVCVASRMAMLTGLYAHHTGAIDNDDSLDWRYRTMAHHWAAHGYLTGLIGKMHFGDAHNHGFAYYLSINDWLMYLGPKVQIYANEVASNPHNYDMFYRTVYDTGTGFPDVYDLWDGGPSPWAGHVTRYDCRSMASELAAEDHLDMFVAREAAKFIRRYRDQRFLLVAGFMKPHTPLFAPAEWAARYPVEDMELPSVGEVAGYPEHIRRRIAHTQQIPPRLRRANHAGYYASLAFVDHCIGYLYDALEEEGLLEETIVVYTSDHGDLLGQHGLYGKFCLFDPSVNAPLIVSYPPALPQGRVSPALVNLIDLYPTLAELTGIGALAAPTLPLPGAPEAIDGRSFAGLLRDPDGQGSGAVFSEYGLRGAVPSYMVRTQQFKYVHNHGATDELYDLEADPGEYVNRVDDGTLRGVREELAERLYAWYDPAANPYQEEAAG